MAIKIQVHQNGNSVGEKGSKWYGYAKCETMIGASDLARILCTHGLALSEGTVIGVIRDLANVIRQQMMEGVAVKIDNLAIFKCTVEANGLSLAKDYKVVAGLGGLPATTNADGTARTPDYTKEAQYAISSARLLAQATGEFTKKELNDDASFRWTRDAQKTINAIVSPAETQEEEGGGE